MPVVLIFMICLLGGIGSLVFFILSLMEVVRNRRAIWSSSLCVLAWAGMVTWLSISGSQEWEEESCSFHELQDFTLFEGGKVQMIAVNGTSHNMTAVFGKMVDPSLFQVKKVNWKRNYCGIAWNGVVGPPVYILVPKK